MNVHPDPVMPDVVTMPEPKSVIYARLFCECPEIKPLFDEAEAKKLENFRLPIAAFDEWVVAYGLIEKGDKGDGEDDNSGAPDPTTFTSVPDKKDVQLWNLFVTKRNKVRIMINQAASMGRHGEPPYSIDTPKTDIEIRSEPTRKNKKGELREVRRKRSVRTYYEVNLVAGLARVTHKDAVAAVKSLLKQKMKGFEARNKMYLKHWHALPMSLQFTLEQEQAMIEDAGGYMGNMLNNVMVRMQNTHERAEEFLKRAQVQAKERAKVQAKERAKVQAKERAKALGMDPPDDA